MGRSRLVVAALLAVLVGGAIPAFGMTPLIAPVFQERRVAGTANASDLSGNVNDGDSKDSMDFLPFSEAAAAQADVPDALGAGGGTQTSTIGDTSLFVSGTTFSNAESYSYDGFADGGGQSLYRVVFDVLQASSFTLTGNIAAYDDGSVELTLRDSGGSIVTDAYAFGPAEDIPVNDAGTLAVGQYTLELDARGDTFADFFNFAYASTEFNVRLNLYVPGPGGVVPDGSDGLPLSVQDLGSGMVRLDWGPSCRMDDSDYAVYEGQLGAYGTLQPATCSSGGALQYDMMPTWPGAFFLVVPTNGATEGSYGYDYGGLERAASGTPCMAQALGTPVCP